MSRMTELLQTSCSAARAAPVLISIFVFCSVPKTDTMVADRPNFVFVLIDDLGWRDIGCYGSSFYETPNIDRLASQGMRFTNAYAAAPVCSPSRASIMTGKHPARLHLTNFLVGQQWPEKSRLWPVKWTRELPSEEVSIAATLRNAGYVTGFIGKWHLGTAPLESFGFSTNIGGSERGWPLPYFDDHGRYLTDTHSSDAEKFMVANRNRPFFLYLSHYAVHVPLEAKKDLIAKYERKAAGLPAGGIPEFGKEHERELRQVQKHPVFAAMIEGVDESVGRVMRTEGSSHRSTDHHNLLLR